MTSPPLEITAFSFSTSNLCKHFRPRLSAAKAPSIPSGLLQRIVLVTFAARNLTRLSRARWRHRGGSHGPTDERGALGFLVWHSATSWSFRQRVFSHDPRCRYPLPTGLQTATAAVHPGESSPFGKGKKEKKRTKRPSQLRGRLDRRLEPGGEKPCARSSLVSSLFCFSLFCVGWRLAGRRSQIL